MEEAAVADATDTQETVAETVEKAVEEINKRGTTVVIATHAKDIVDQMQKRVITLENGHIIRDKKGGYSDEI